MDEMTSLQSREIHISVKHRETDNPNFIHCMDRSIVYDIMVLGKYQIKEECYTSTIILNLSGMHMYPSNPMNQELVNHRFTNKNSVKEIKGKKNEEFLRMESSQSTLALLNY